MKFLKINASWKWGGGVFAFVFLAAAQIRIVNYVCGNDPMLYIRAARVLLRPDIYGPEAVRHALTFVAPGYPLLLALGIRVFGPLAPYWINVFFLIGCVPLLWGIFRGLMRSERAAALSLALMWPLIFGGHVLHAPYLLYPFREAPRLFFVFLGYYLALRARRLARGWPFFLILAAFAFLFACLIREPSALVLPGFFLGLVFLNIPPAQIWKLLSVSLFPWLLLGALGLVAFQRVDLYDVSQFSVVRYLSGHGVAWSRIREMAAWFPGRLGWTGLTLVLIGVARALKSARALFCWFFIPATIFFVFYAYMHMHTRYFLTALIFMSVFAGYGLDLLLGGLHRITLPRKLTVARPWILSGGLALFLMSSALNTLRDLDVWGPKISAKRVRQWQDLIAALEPGADGRIHVAVEQRARYVEDLLMSYTDANLLDPKLASSWPATVFPAHYFHPLNRAALWDTLQWLDGLKIFADRIMGHFHDLEPAGGLEERPPPRIGKGVYRQYLISARRAGVHEQPLVLRGDAAHIAWLDWRGPPSDMGVVAGIIDEGIDGMYAPLSLEDAQPLHALYLPEGHSGALSLRYEAGVPLPKRPVIRADECGVIQWFSLTQQRPPSANHWISGRSPHDLETYPVMLRSDRSVSLRIPRLLNAPPGYWDVALLLNPLRHVRGQALAARQEAGRPARIPIPADVREISFQIEPGAEVILELETEDSGQRDTREIHAISFRFQLSGFEDNMPP